MGDIEFKRQTCRSTRMDKTTNISLIFGEFEFAVVSSAYWGDFSSYDSRNPLLEITLDGKNYRMRLDEFKDRLRKVVR